MKAYYLLAPLLAALLGGCAYYTTAPAPVAYVSSPRVAYVAPTYVAPPYTVIAP
jgi:hypothetical protein